MRKTGSVVVLAAMLAVTGCAEDQGTKQTVGQVGGGIAGAVLGAQIGGGTGQLIATAAGALLGAYVGGEIGKSLDRADRLTAERTAQNALEHNPSGVASTWSNPDSGNSGRVTPQRTYRSPAGRDCREYTTVVNVDGRSEERKATACRQADGTWELMDS